MSEMDPTIQNEYQDNTSNKEEDERVRIRNEQSARSFFALLSFLVALILLAVFINNPLDAISRMLVLCALIAFGMIGMLLLDKRRELSSLLTNNAHSQDEEEPAQDEDDGTETTDELSPFEQLVQDALDSIPPEFQEKMQNLVVIVENEPSAEVLARGDVADEGSLLLGLYHGVPLPAQGSNGPLLPERITIYQQNIESICHYDPTRIREQVRQTVLHEIAHHFGMDHEEMPIWIR